MTRSHPESGTYLGGRSVSSQGIKVEYVYVLNDWFKKPKYKDALDYIHSVNCHYKFNQLPLAWLGLPTS